MADETSGMGAEVGLRKRDEDGNVQQREGFLKPNWPRYVAYIVFLLAGFGLYRIFEILFL